MPDDFRILFVADVVGAPGRDAVKAILPELKKEVQPHLTILNGENSAGGFGITGKLVAELKAAGADVITTGNHVWDQKQFVDELPGLERVLRPHNFPPGAPGTGFCVVAAGGEEVLVMNLMGRLFMNDIDDPFRSADAILAGRLDTYVPPGGPWTRVDSHCYPGWMISPFYDSLIAKLIVWAPDRDRAIDRMQRALSEFEISGRGVKTTIPFHQRILAHIGNILTYVDGADEVA